MVAATMRAVTNADDWSTMLSKVFDTAKDLVKGGLLPLVYDAMRKNEDNAEIQVELMGALKGCSIQDEIVKGIVSEGGLALALGAFKQHMSHPNVAQRSMLLLSNMAENDDVKKILCEGDALPLMLTCMQLHGKVARVVAAGFTAIASMALRMPDNVELMMEAGTARVLIEGMRAHGSVSELNRQAMIAIRNMVVRCPQHKEAFLAEGAEELIVNARDTHIKCADAAFDCLRDLGCEYGGLGDLAGKGKHSAYVHVSGTPSTSITTYATLPPTEWCDCCSHCVCPLLDRRVGFSSRLAAVCIDPDALVRSVKRASSKASRGRQTLGVPWSRGRRRTRGARAVGLVLDHCRYRTALASSRACVKPAFGHASATLFFVVTVMRTLRSFRAAPGRCSSVCSVLRQWFIGSAMNIKVLDQKCTQACWRSGYAQQGPFYH